MKNTTLKKSDGGFSMLELLVATALFLIVSAAALSLFSSHLPVFREQQSQAGLNISMRNAVSQLQLDVANAGSGYYQGINIPDFPISLTIQNNVATTSAPCNTPSTFTYGTNCFDVLNVILFDPSTPPAHVDQSGTSCQSETSSILFANPVGSTTPAQLAADYHTGDQILVYDTSTMPATMASVVLSKDGKVAGGKVQLQHNPTATPQDPTLIYTLPSNKLGTQFCSSAWICKIIPITYKVDTTVPSDPKLIREQPSGNTSNDVVLAEQVIGFKVGAILWNNCTGTCTSDDLSTYNYDSTTYSSGGTLSQNDYTLIQSVQIEMIGRTIPNFAPTYVFRNGFDQGPYQIESASMVINPRNITMNNH